MTNKLTTIAIAIAIAITTAGQSHAPTNYSADTITEDNPAWDCRVMGNRICGQDSGDWESDTGEYIGGYN